MGGIVMDLSDVRASLTNLEDSAFSGAKLYIYILKNW